MLPIALAAWSDPMLLKGLRDGLVLTILATGEGLPKQALLPSAEGAAQHHFPAAARESAGPEPVRKYLAVSQGDLDFRPGLQILHGHSRSLLRSLEQTEVGSVID